MCRLCITATKQHFQYLTYKTKNCECSVDTHFRNGAVTKSLSLLPTNAVYTSVMHNSDQITFQLPYIQDQKSVAVVLNPNTQYNMY